MNERYIPREQLGDISRYVMGNLGRARPAAAANAATGKGTHGHGPAQEHDTHARDAAIKAGHDAGYAAGMAQGRADAARLHALAETMSAAVGRFEAGTAEEVTDLALAIARQILRGNVELRRATLIEVVREALAQLPPDMRQPQLAVHPSDLPLVRAQLGDLIDRSTWKIVDDHRIEPGGCRIDGAEGGVDATLPERWRRVCSAIGREMDWNDA